MEIKIIDKHTTKGKELKNRVLKAVETYEKNVTISLLNDIDELKKYKIKSFPALVINNNLETEGRVVSTREIIKILKRYE